VGRGHGRRRRVFGILIGKTGIDKTVKILYNLYINNKEVSMKNFLVAVAFGLMAVAAQAEATFDQIEGLIQQKNYAAAEAGLEVIIQNHPKSAKAFYAMAQAQAGLGNLDKAQKALNIATGLNPTLDFVPFDSVTKLKQAITPQTTKIVAVEETHFWRNTIMALILASAIGFAFMLYMRKEQEAEAKAEAEREAELTRIREERDAKRKQEHMDMLAKQDAERKAELAAEAALRAHKNYGHERFDPSNPDKLKSVKQFKEEQTVAKQAAELREAQARADAAEASARMYRTSAQAVQPSTTVVNNSSNDMLTGVLIGNMLSGSHHHDTERTVVRETVREVPAPSRSSSWDDTPSTSKSSSWSSSSDSSSSSSWDSGSSSSSSDSSSSSSWD